jgi:hypothetical protein
MAQRRAVVCALLPTSDLVLRGPALRSTRISAFSMHQYCKHSNAMRGTGGKLAQAFFFFPASQTSDCIVRERRRNVSGRVTLN